MRLKDAWSSLMGTPLDTFPDTKKITLLTYVFLASITPLNAVEHPEEFPNLLAGTFTDGQRFSTGNTLPLVGRPWGFNHWAPQTNSGRSSWWFSGNDHTFRWIRCTHQPSPWIGDYGWFLLGPQMGGATSDPVGFWEPRGATIKPFVFDATTGPDGMRIELAPSMHGAILKVTFPEFNPYGNDKRICFKMDDNDWDRLDKSGAGVGTLTGTSTRVGGHPSNFRHHIRAIGDDRVDKVEHVGRNTACFTYPKNQVVATVRIATSFIDQAQAATNWEREVSPTAHADFESLKREGREEWRALLGRVDVKDPGGSGVLSAAAAAATLEAGEGGEHEEAAERHLSVFYTGLYRALTFPRLIQEIDANGKMVHYSPYAPRGGVREGPLCTDNGFWDTFRTVYPLLGLLYPDKLGTIIQGWLNAYKEGGWIPGWASPGYRESMVGTYGDVVVADAIVKKIPGFEVRTAWEALHRDSFEDEPGGHNGVGKAGLRYYDQFKYIPSDVGVSEQVSRSLDFAFADVAVAKAAEVLSASFASSYSESQRFDQDGRRLKERGLAVQRNCFDPSTGLMRPKNRGGRFDGGFQANRWGGSYTEGSAWHHSFPPFAVDDLASLHGGRDNLLRKLHELLQTPGTFNVGGYGQEIHEMTEMRAVAMGQYGHNNQPAHHILYLFALLGDHDSTADNVRKVMDHAYGVDFYAGDEDNGEMGSWFVLSALGLYAAAPGATNEYVLGTPLFRHVVVNLPALDACPDLQAPARPARTLHVVALGAGPGQWRVKQMSWNGQTLTGPLPVLGDDVVQQGGVLRFVMQGEPFPALPFDPALGTLGSVAHGEGNGVVRLKSSFGVLEGGGNSASASPGRRQGSGGMSGGGGGGEGAESAQVLASRLQAAELEAAEKEAELEAFKRSSTSLSGSLKEQLDTYSAQAETAEAQLEQARQELASEQLARKQEAARLQAALQEQGVEMKGLEAQIEHLMQQAENAAAMGASGDSSSGGGGGGEAHAQKQAALEAEVGALKLALEVETKEHKRAALLLDMLSDHNKRVGSLREATTAAAGDASTSSSGGGGGGGSGGGGGKGSVASFAAAAAEGAATFRAGASLSTSFVEAASYGGFVLGLLVCVWALCCSGRGASSPAGKDRRRSRRHKDNTHIV